MNRKNRLLALLAALVLSAGIMGCTGNPEDDSESTIRDIPSITPESNPKDVEEDESGKGSKGKEDSEPEESSSSKQESDLPEYAKVGQVVTGDDWSIALLYAKEYDSIGSEFYSDQPSEGKKFLVLFFDVMNVSSENDHFNPFYFEGYADDYSTNAAFITSEPDEMQDLGGDIDAGKMAKGYMVYEVPSDWKTFEISYKDGIWTSHRAATFLVNREDVSPQDYSYTSSVFPEYVMDSSKMTDIGTEITGEKWNVKLVDVKKCVEIEDLFRQKADEGKEFVIFFLEAKNTSSEDDYFNPFFFRFYVDGYLTDQTLLYNDIDGYEGIGADVAAGKKTKGYIAVQAPSGWKSLELVYDEWMLTRNSVAEFGILNE